MELFKLQDFAINDSIVGKEVILPERGQFYPAYVTKFTDIPRSEKYYEDGSEIQHKKAKVVGAYKHCYSSNRILVKVEYKGKYAFTDKSSVKLAQGGH